MSKKYTTMLIVVVSVIAIIGIAVGVSFAIWVNNESEMDPQDLTEVMPVNTTGKYLVYEVSDGTNFMYARYYVDVDATGTKTGSFKYSKVDKDRYLDGVESLATGATYSAKVIGFTDGYYIKDLSLQPTPDSAYRYVGYSVGEVETIEIPETIPVQIGEGVETVNVTEIAMQSPEEFKPLLNIKSVYISKNVAKISGVSFSGCVNLKAIEYATGSPITSENVGEFCFKGCANAREFYLPKAPVNP